MNGGRRRDFLAVLDACRRAKDLEQGRRVHLQLLQTSWRSDKFLGDLLVRMYSRCGSVQDARQAFDGTASKDVQSWNVLIVAYAQNGKLHKASEAFERMPCRDVSSWNTMLGAYSYNSIVLDAKQVFDGMLARNQVSWNSMLSAFAQKGHFEGAKNTFDRMPQRDMVSWNAFIAVSASKRYSDVTELYFSKMPHRNLMAWNTLLHVYALCRQMHSAQAVFDKMPERGIVSWNTILTGYVEQGDVLEAKQVFDEMPDRDVFSWSSMLRGFVQDAVEAELLFTKMPKMNVVSWTSMLQCYTHTGNVRKAWEIFQRMPEKDMVAWNCILTGFKASGLLASMMQVYEKMPKYGLVTWNTAVTAFAAAKDVAGAKHFFLHRMPYQEPATLSVLITELGRNGLLEEAKRAFAGAAAAQENDAASSWTALIAAYGKHGQAEQAIAKMQEMCVEGVQPSDSAFLSLLIACSYMGMVPECRLWFRIMVSDFCAHARIDHYHCVADALGRAGHLKLAEELLSCMPFKPDRVARTALLGMCRMHQDAAHAARVVEEYIELEPRSSAAHVLFSDILRGGGDHGHCSPSAI